MGDLLADPHERTIRQGIHETARQLVAHLGPTAVSYLAGAKDRRSATNWSKAGNQTPRDPARARLLTAHTAWGLIAEADNEYVARNWFIGTNPRLDDRSPIEALRDGELDRVAAAARAFAAGTDE